MRIEAPALDFVDTVVNVRYAETDQMGVVYYANYLVWFEVGRVAWCRARGFSYRDMEIEDGHRMMVAAAASASEKVIRFSYEVRDKKTWKLLATGETAHVVTDLNNRPSRLPARYRKYFRLRTG